MEFYCILQLHYKYKDSNPLREYGFNLTCLPVLNNHIDSLTIDFNPALIVGTVSTYYTNQSTEYLAIYEGDQLVEKLGSVSERVARNIGTISTNRLHFISPKFLFLKKNQYLCICD